MSDEGAPKSAYELAMEKLKARGGYEERKLTDEQKIARAKTGPDIHCGVCGARNTADAKVCSQCGADLTQGKARAAGQVGEMPNGYLGFPTPPSADVRRMAEDINIKRKAVYAQRAQANGSTIEEYAITAGCQAIARTVPGEKYQAPDGSWRTRGAEKPVLGSLCPDL